MKISSLILMPIFFISSSLCNANEMISSQEIVSEMPNVEIKVFDPKMETDEIILKLLGEKDPGHTKYYLEFKGFPIEKEIIFTMKRLVGGDSEKVCYREINRFRMCSHGRLVFNEEIWIPYFTLSSRGFLPGEKIYCRFQTEDNEFDYEVAFIPNKMITYNKSKTISVEAELVSYVLTMYSIKIKGLKEGEEYLVRSKSEDEIIESRCKFSEPTSHNLMPGVSGISGGVCQFQVITKSKDFIKLSLPWGMVFAEYLKGDKIYCP